MADDEVFEAGIALRTAMFGEQSLAMPDTGELALYEKIGDVVTRQCFGDVWQRDGLSLADRSKVTFAMLVALGKSHEMRIHARGALSNGVSPTELREIATHSFLYCGIPAAIEATRALEEVLGERSPAASVTVTVDE